MADIYVTGHRNPDMDSICAAYGYAYLKNKTDANNNYIAMRCGNLNEATRAQFERLGLLAPPFVRDVRTKVERVIKTSEVTVDVSDPIFTLVSFYSTASLSTVVPVMEEGEDRAWCPSMMSVVSSSRRTARAALLPFCDRQLSQGH